MFGTAELLSAQRIELWLHYVFSYISALTPSSFCQSLESCALFFLELWARGCTALRSTAPEALVVDGVGWGGLREWSGSMPLEAWGCVRLSERGARGCMPLEACGCVMTIR